MGTYEIDEFSYLKETEPEAWRSLYNHHRYGVVGTRGFVGGAGLALATMFTFLGRSHPVIPLGLFVAGFIYGMNSRHMARHNLHKAINILNKAQDYGRTPKPQIDFMFSPSETLLLGVAVHF